MIFNTITFILCLPLYFFIAFFANIIINYHGGKIQFFRFFLHLIAAHAICALFGKFTMSPIIDWRNSKPDEIFIAVSLTATLTFLYFLFIYRHKFPSRSLTYLAATLGTSIIVDLVFLLKVYFFMGW